MELYRPNRQNCGGSPQTSDNQHRSANLTTLIDHAAPAKTAKCGACGKINSSESLFCDRCTAPLSVMGLDELTSDDRRNCLSALLGVLADALKDKPATAQAVHDESLWQAYLSAFWLRPETALILYAEALAIRAACTSHPWLDLGCGDGIHAALYSGWRFDPIFDAFQSLDLTAADIYHHWHPDQFDVNVLTLGEKISHGIDIKSTAVARAQSLGVFQNVRQADATRLPLADKSVRTIFSNMLRDLGDPLPAALSECRRILTDDGTLLISTMTQAYANHLYFAPAARAAKARGDGDAARDLLRLDRGRSTFCQRQLSINEWQNLLQKSELKISGVQPIVGPAIIRFWDIGLRPFSITLLKQRDLWKQRGILTEMKAAIIPFLSQVLEPLLSNLTAGEACMNLLSITKA